MKLNTKTFLAFIVIGGFATSNALAQESSLGGQVNKKVGMYVFPAKDQTKDQQDKDESDCYKWAVQQCGYDPLNPTKVEAAPVQTGPDGSAVVGGAKGAAAGAAIGAIAGDAGKGAAIGAIAGGLAGRRASRAHHAAAEQSSQQAAANQETEMVNSFKKAYTVCLEGKGYTAQ